MSTVQLRAFRPLGQNYTANISVTASNTVTTLPVIGFGTRSIRLVNLGTQIVYVEFGAAGSVATTTTSLPLLSNTVETFTIGGDITAIATIAPSTGSVLFLTCGEGL